MVLEREVASDPFSSPTGADALRRLPPGSSWQVAEDRLAGLRADPAKSSLAAYHRVDATPAVGTEFPASSGIQLSKLTDQQVEDLALLVAERGVVFFREQDITEEQQRTLGAKLGPLHVHPIGRSSDKEREEFQEFEFGSESKAVAGEGWHTDISFEEKPSAYAILKLTEVPPNGGDTLWVSTYAAYDKLTPAYRRILEGLEAYHTNAHRHYASLSDASLGASGARAPILRRGPNTALHPVVRTHPLTKWKSLYVNQVRFSGLFPFANPI
ncbi:hypothetical protein DFJ74DRAFT_691767 [Hyaloraphidium curvatum]|nr:hypothetical protein DFJ74DRAFT_691767 [Hyaloraphidium curvatum]